MVPINKLQIKINVRKKQCFGQSQRTPREGAPVRKLCTMRNFAGVKTGLFKTLFTRHKPTACPLKTRWVASELLVIWGEPFFLIREMAAVACAWSYMGRLLLCPKMVTRMSLLASKSYGIQKPQLAQAFVLTLQLIKIGQRKRSPKGPPFFVGRWLTLQSLLVTHS